TSGPAVLGMVGASSRVEYGAVGDAVNTAARLQAAAEPGTVLVGAATHRMVEPLFEWEPRVELELKGKAGAVAAHRAVRPGAAQLYPYLGAMLGLALEPEAADRLAELSPEALQYRTFEVVRHWIERLATDGPVVVAIEDLHWADTTSTQLVGRLLSLTEEAP